MSPVKKNCSLCLDLVLFSSSSVSLVLPQDTGRSHRTQLNQASVSWWRLAARESCQNSAYAAGLTRVLEPEPLICYSFFPLFRHNTGQCLSTPRIRAASQTAGKESRRGRRTGTAGTACSKPTKRRHSHRSYLTNGITYYLQFGSTELYVTDFNFFHASCKLLSALIV